MARCSDPPVAEDRGMGLVELLIALLILTLGVMALARVFPTATRTQVQDRMRVEASQCMREEIERLQALDWADAELSVGRHPAGSAVELVNSTGNLGRFYQVAVLPGTLADLKRVTVTTRWRHLKPCSLQTITYLRK